MNKVMRPMISPRRIMQLLRVVNRMLSSDRRTRSHPSLRARHYAVLPLGRRSGLIQWVQGVTPMYAVYKAWQHRAAAAAAAPKAANDADATAAPVLVPRPADAFYAKLGPALKSKVPPHHVCMDLVLLCA